MRAIAADAGVSPNLVTRYFGGKRGLFAAATQIELDVRGALPGPDDQLGLRIARHVVVRWESRPGDDPLLTLLRAAATDPDVAAEAGATFHRQAHVELVAHLGGSDAEARAAAVGAVIKGTVMDRYVLRAGPLAGAAPEAVVGWLGAVLQPLLRGPSLPALTPG